MAATKEQLTWAADHFGYEVNAHEVVIIHDSGAEEHVTMLVPDSEKPLASTDDTAKK